MVKEVLSLPGTENILQYDPLADPDDATAFAWMGTLLQVAILTSLSDDDTGTGLVFKMIEAWQAGQTLDLSDVDVLGDIIGVTPDPDGNHPEPLAEILDRCESIASIVDDMGGQDELDIEWADFASVQETIDVGSIQGLITSINQAPEGFGQATLEADAGASVTITNAQLLAGYSDPEGGTLKVTGLTADAAGSLVKVAGGWAYTPTEAGAVELSYTVSDKGGLSVAAAAEDGNGLGCRQRSQTVQHDAQ